jgi:DNA-binding SARP family transcriptional activator
LAARVTLQSDESVSLALNHAIADFDRLLRIAAECSAKSGMLSPDEAKEAFQILAGTDGEFLPEWDRLEDQVTAGRGSAGELVQQLRTRAEDARIDILTCLAANHLARREAERAIPLLERALERRPDREGVARTLIAAYMEAGQLQRAAELQRELAL